ncbi:WAT1-related protein At5g64700-like [Carex rostrata]
MSLRIFVKIFFLTTVGVACSLNLFNLGIKYTSSTVASAVTNAVPVVTFTLAVLLRIESVKLKEATGIAKVFGIVLCLAGVLVLAFYEGPHLKSMSHDRPILHQSNSKQGSHSKSEWIIGTFVMILSAVTWSLWIILQGPILNQYPSKLMFSATCNFLGTIQSFFVALVAERDFNKWKLHFDDGLLGVSYNGLFVSGISFYLQAWCIEKKGAVFLAVWQPLSLLTTLVCSSFFLGETINLGSVLGGLLMVGGLYSVLWGKGKESSEIPTNASIRSNTNEPEVLVGAFATRD